MSRKQRIAAANSRGRKLKQRTTILAPREQAAQSFMVSRLLELVEAIRHEFPGVWHSGTVEDLENMAFQLDELAEQDIAPRIILSWQPPLFGEAARSEPDENADTA